MATAGPNKGFKTYHSKIFQQHDQNVNLIRSFSFKHLHRAFEGHPVLLKDELPSQATSRHTFLPDKYSVPFEVVAVLEELFSPPWLSLEPPRLHQILTLVSRVPHKNFSALRPKKWAFETEQPSPPLRSPEVGELLSKKVKVS